MSIPNGKLKFDEKKVNFDMLTSSMNISHLDCTDDDGGDPEELNDFIHKKALDHQNNKLGFTHIISYDGIPIGYVTIAASRIEHKKMTKGSTPKSNLSTYPAIIISNLAIDKKQRDKGFGDYLLFLVVGYCRQKITERIACRFLILRAKEKLARFYTDNKFQVALQQENQEYKLMYIDLFPELNVKKEK